MFGQVTSRHRLYMVCVREHILDSAGMSATDVRDYTSEIMNKLVGGHAFVPLESVLPERFVHHSRLKRSFQTVR
jgi:hypothetical protein